MQDVSQYLSFPAKQVNNVIGLPPQQFCSIQSSPAPNRINCTRVVIAAILLTQTDL